MPAALEGIRVLDLTIGQQGPYASVMLADMGAEVIKVENPEFGGDPMRSQGTRAARGVLGGHVMAKGVNAYFETNNRNKKSMTVNLKTAAGKEIMRRMAAVSDVFMQNFRPGVLERLGLGYEDVARCREDIIYASAAGFGPEGEGADRAAVDLVAQARGGLMSIIVGPDGSPGWVPSGLADQMGAIMMAHGIVVALLARARWGVGQRVDTSLLGSQIALQGFYLQGTLLSGELPPPRWHRDTPPLWNTYRARDGKWLALAILGQRFWQPLCRALEIGEAERDPRFATLEAREQNRQELISLLEHVFSTRDREEWLGRLEAEDLVAAPVQDYTELAQDPLVLHNRYLVDLDHPVAGPMKVLGFPIGLSRTPGAIRSAAPGVGEHTEEVLQELAGYKAADIARFREEGVI